MATTTTRRKKAAPEGFLWLEQAAEYIGFSPYTLYKWRQNGTGPKGHVIGLRQIAYEIAELNRFLKPPEIGQKAA